MMDMTKHTNRSNAYEVAEMLNGLCEIQSMRGRAIVCGHSGLNLFVFFKCPAPVEELEAHFFAWACGVRGWDMFEHGYNEHTQWFKLAEVVQPEAFTP